VKDDIQEKDRGDLEEASTDLSDTESSAKADTIITVQQTNQGVVHGKGEIRFTEYEA